MLSRVCFLLLVKVEEPTILGRCCEVLELSLSVIVRQATARNGIPVWIVSNHRLRHRRKKENKHASTEIEILILTNEIQIKIYARFELVSSCDVK